MKLLSVASAKSIWLVPSAFLNPKGLSIWPLIKAARERYLFQKVPTELPLNASDGWKFEGGSFKAPDGSAVIVHLSIHTDGLVAETRSSTANGDLFLEDLLDWAAKEHGLLPPRSLLIQRVYASEIFVELEKTPRLYDERLESMLKEASGYISDAQRGPLQFFSLTFGTDPARSDRQVTLKIERQTAAPFAQNHYYSFAGTETDKHLRLLEQLESLA